MSITSVLKNARKEVSDPRETFLKSVISTGEAFLKPSYFLPIKQTQVVPTRQIPPAAEPRFISPRVVIKARKRDTVKVCPPARIQYKMNLGQVSLQNSLDGDNQWYEPPSLLSKQGVDDIIYPPTKQLIS